MPVSTEDAIRIAILNHPETFGLNLSEVNPLLLYQLRRAELAEDQIGAGEAAHCFELCQANLHRKVLELLSVVDRIRENAVIATEPERELAKSVNVEPSSNGKADAAAGPERTNGNGKPATNGKPVGNGEVVGSPARELSVKQLRYLGYLIRQTGKEPDYKDISRLSQTAATMRIKELELELKGVEGGQ